MGLAAQRGNIVAAEPDLQSDAVVFNVLRKQQILLRSNCEEHCWEWEEWRERGEMNVTWGARNMTGVPYKSAEVQLRTVCMLLPFGKVEHTSLTAQAHHCADLSYHGSPLSLPMCQK